jgi:hypothetical protein
MWDDFMALMRAREVQLTLPANPTHKESREQTNYVLHHHPGFYVHPRCRGLIFDLQNVEVDENLSIVKSDRSKEAQKADYLDTARSVVNTYLYDWIKRHRKTNALQRLPHSPPAPTVLRR